MLAGSSRICKILCVLCIIVTSFCASAITGAEEVPIQWREAFVTVESTRTPVDGHQEHALGLMRQRGFAFFDNDEVASVNVLLIFERRGNTTQYTGYAVYTFADGATKIGRFEGHGDPVGKQSGKFSFEGGTGRYQGITGKGTFTGQGFPPHGDIVLDVTGSYSLEEKPDD